MGTKIDVRGHARAEAVDSLQGKDETLNISAPDRHSHTTPVFRLLGVDIDNITMSQALDRIERWAVEATSRHVAFVNAACMNIASENATYREVLGTCDLVLADGIGVRLGGRFQGIDVVDNVNGTDMFPLLCERAARSGTGIYLLGSADGVAAATAELMSDRYPGLRIVGTHHGYFAPEDEAAVVADINASGAGILLAAFGVPQQELWLDRVGDQLTVPVRIGVGALFDLTSGRLPRAPLPVRKVHMEWAWRLAMEPRRMWRRYVLGNPVFLARAYRDARETRSTTPQETP